MLIFLSALLIIWTGLLIYSESMFPPETDLSMFELERRRNKNVSDSPLIYERQEYVTHILSLKRVIVSLLLILTVIWSVWALGYLFGSLVALIIGLFYMSIARAHFIQVSSAKIYLRIEPALLDTIKKHPQFFKIFNMNNHGIEQRLGSRQELEHLIETSHSVLSADEKKLIVNGLSFDERMVHEIMIPKSMIDVVNKTEFLGPLVLDDLHKTGHSRLPVIDKDIDHIVGVLHLEGLLALDVKRSVSAEKAMEPQVFYIREDQSLRHALNAFLKTRHHLFIVINEYRETVGLLSLEDVMEALLGHKITDDFEGHDNLRAVALRNPHENNQPKEAEDV
jgi:CBS domain containing-hemolysin-like protein